MVVQALEARRSERLWRERVAAFSSAVEQQKEDALDITADMMRQYKGMQVGEGAVHKRYRRQVEGRGGRGQGAVAGGHGED